MDAGITLAAGLLLLAPLGLADPTAGPRFEGERLAFPADYREWVFLSAGYDMSYSPFNGTAHHVFDEASWMTRSSGGGCVSQRSGAAS